MSNEAAPEPAAAAPGTEGRPRWSPPGNRVLTDPRDMRALAHPTRIALLEALAVHGPLTATQAGELIGESASSCSFHLRTLARHNFVEETGEGRGRERPWRRVTTSLSMPDYAADHETFVAATALSQLVTERQLARLRQWQERRPTADQAWIDAAEHAEMITWATPQELRDLNEAVLEAMSRFQGRLDDPSTRPADAELVELVYFSYPSSVGSAGDE